MIAPVYSYTYTHRSDGQTYTASVTILERGEHEGNVVYVFAPVYGWPHHGGAKEKNGTLILTSAVITPEEEHAFKHEFLVDQWGFGDS